MKEEENALSAEFVNHIEQIVKTITEQKRKAFIQPWHAIDLEVIKAAESKGYKESDVKLALNKLYKEKRVAFGQTMNNLWFAVKEHTNN